MQALGEVRRGSGPRASICLTWVEPRLCPSACRPRTGTGRTALWRWTPGQPLSLLCFPDQLSRKTSPLWCRWLLPQPPCNFNEHLLLSRWTQQRANRTSANLHSWHYKEISKNGGVTPVYIKPCWKQGTVLPEISQRRVALSMGFSCLEFLTWELSVYHLQIVWNVCPKTPRWNMPGPSPFSVPETSTFS